MDCADGYSSRVIKLDKFGEDENGKYELIEVQYEEPCGCHPETCCHGNGRRWASREYKKYF
jgi:hypothetical protein